MSDTAFDVESQAHQLAARGRDVLVERMRTAYGDAAAAQADLVTLDDERIEAMVQAAADRADGLQWRRALAAVAAEEFGISAADALAHPAVVRAQALVGAPSYEQSLAEMIARPVPPATAPPTAAVPAVSAAPNFDATRGNGATAPEPEAPEPEAPEPEASEPEQSEPEQSQPEPPQAEPLAPEPADYAEEPSDELETVEADDIVLELLPAPDPVEYETEAIAADPAAHETQAYDVEASFAEEQVPPAPTNPFAAPTPERIDEPEVEEQRAPEAVTEDEYAPPTEQHHAAGVAAAFAAISVPGSVPDPVESDPHAASEPPAPESEPEPELEPAAERIEVSFPAVHLGGVANLPTKREGLSVRLSEDGLDILEGPREIIGRLIWDEIEALEVPDLRMRRRQKQVRARLVVRTPHGDASFEVPDVTAEELRDRVEPLMRLYGH